ncbi:hypothetical protein [Aliagarivorans taiwanensis]|uniref:hypothetical protein n=1 Tax=Aliagarivorans taiwanensis TaxID=561966 RepID=UPI000416A501|nr:hypothetical protein [Aliagarivorans taiwanensis]
MVHNPKFRVSQLQEKPPAINEIEEQTGLEARTVGSILPVVKKDILRTWHTGGKDQQVDARVESAWEKTFGYPFNAASEKITPIVIKGPPGHGKTTTWRVACRELAQEMGVRYWQNPTTEQLPKVAPEDVVLVMEDMAGEVTASALRGVTHISEQNGTSVSSFAPPQRILFTRDQDCSVFLLDDLENAMVNVKNRMLSALEEKKINDVNLGERSYVAGTGNFGGKIDGTNTTKESSALTSRTQVLFGYDTVGNWMDRAEQRFDDSIGTAYVVDYLMEHPGNFHPIRDPKARGPIATPRSWDAFLNRMRDIIGDYEAQVGAGLNPPPPLDMIRMQASASLGKALATDLSAFYQNLFSVARPAAKELLSKAGLSDNTRALLTDVVVNQKDSASYTATRAYLSTVMKAAAPKVFDGLNVSPDATEEDKKLGRAKAGFYLRKVAEACFGSGMVAGAKGNLVTQALQDFSRDVIAIAEQTDAVTFDFGHFNSNGEPRLGVDLFKALTNFCSKVNSSDHPHGEALNVVAKHSKGGGLTALESFLKDGLTATEQIQDAQEAAHLAMS